MRRARRKKEANKAEKSLENSAIRVQDVGVYVHGRRKYGGNKVAGGKQTE